MELLQVLATVVMRISKVEIAARMFDHIIIRQEKYLRGRTEDEIIDLILEGIKNSGKDVTYEIIPKETEAIRHAINSA